MNERVAGGAGSVVYLRPGDARAARRRAVAERLGNAARVVGSAVATVASVAIGAAWGVARLALCAVLVMIEPLLRATLVPIAFLSFIITLVFGFLAETEGFPKWGMLAFSVGTLWVYWAYLALLSFLTRLPRGRD